MSAKLTISNQDRTSEYVAVLDGKDAALLYPLQTAEIEIEAGQHELTFREGEEAEIPGSCKPICFNIPDNKTFSMKVITNLLSIQILDAQGNLLNGRHGFLCGYVDEGVYVENPIA
ncbi:MAG: hypothetical protein PHY31_00125 [Smithellaceae bacterium]|nr:hypothetical protein [Smithellaceae bacterium]